MLISDHSFELLLGIIAQLRSRSKMLDCGEAKIFLGLEIQLHKAVRELKRCRKSYIFILSELFSMPYAKPCQMLMEQQIFNVNLNEKKLCSTMYRLKIDSLIYLMI